MSITSSLPGSPPIPSTDINANLLSGEMTTPCETLVVLFTSFDFPVLRFLIYVFPSPFRVITIRDPSEEMSVL